MQIIITGQQINLGNSLRQYIENVLEGAVSKYFEKAVSADVRIYKERNEVKAEITVRPIGGVLVKAVGESGDPYAAFDVAAAKLARQLRKYKNKLVDHQVKVEPVKSLVIETVSETEEAGDAPVIIAEMQEKIPVCTVAAAVMRMDLEGLPALMFRNTAHGGLNMVYRRNDGNIGWVDAK